MKSPPSLGPNSVAAALVFAGPLKKNLVKKYIPTDPAENLHAARANSAIGECGRILGKIQN